MKGCCLAAIKGCCLAALYLACNACCAYASGDGAEAAAVYDVGAGTNSIVAVPAEGFAETLAFMLVPAASADEAGLEGAEEDSEAAWHAYADGDEEPTVLASGEFITPSSTAVYQIALDGTFVLVPVEVADPGAYALFVEHGTGEVETGLASPSGIVLTAAASEGGEDEEEEEEEGSFGSATGSIWANAIAASFAVSAASLAGLVVVMNKKVAHSIDLSNAFTFASGALLAASFLHIIPEAMEGLAGDGVSLHDMGLDAGLSILVGLFFSIVIRAMLETGETEGAVGPAQAPADGTSLGAPGQQTAVIKHDCGTTRPRLSGAENLWELISARKGRSLFNIKGLHPVCWNVIIGDLVHNFADGFVIGGAFLGCGNTIGWTVTASTVMHEIPHEIADFMALLNGGMSVKQAFAYNFMSALSAVLGVIIILALTDSLSDAQISIIILLGAGSFIFIGLSELLPGALNAHVAKDGKGAVQRSQFRKLASFTVGALLIGVPLMFDQHCEAGGGHDH